ncbi:MAG: succinate dehydrogenase cytochrome b subunit [Halobacteriovoraceae bacterium]|jgi:succinate dehydrogenase / fumarate reductase, cytochrome b subunit|nr:succinate dehydrogenase cytochrome b subunit [Halobacteriovoraceae bacterium]MBT5094727.1 succinate dehydrogenase cytochrome b subunit [Halobacteriovoraceae bacterium]
MASKLMKTLNSSIVKKQMMAVSGLMLCGFLVSHLIGNCLIYVGAEAFNTYAHTLITNPLIYLAEAILASLFLFHIGMGIRLTVENRKARPDRYFVKQHSGAGATFASATMPYTGLIILAFLIYHLINFKYGPYYTISHGGVEMRDLYRLLIEYFSAPLNVFIYIACMVALGIHLSHGFWSAFQSLGVDHPKYTPCIKLIAKLYAVAMTVGYSALPLYCYLAKGGY